MVEAPKFPYAFIDQIIISQEDIEKRVNALGEQITSDYRNSKNLLLLGLLRTGGNRGLVPLPLLPF